MSTTWITPGALSVLGVDQDLLLAVLVVAGLGSGVIIAVAVAALARRRTWSYLLVTLALATLLARTLLGSLVHVDLLEPTPHHVLEHTLDVIAVLMLFGALYCVRTLARTDGEIRD